MPATCSDGQVRSCTPRAGCAQASERSGLNSEPPRPRWSWSRSHSSASQEHISLCSSRWPSLQRHPRGLCPCTWQQKKPGSLQEGSKPVANDTRCAGGLPSPILTRAEGEFTEKLVGKVCPRWGLQCVLTITNSPAPHPHPALFIAEESTVCKTRSQWELLPHFPKAITACKIKITGCRDKISLR